MKFKNIFFGFFKTLLLTTIFYSSSLYAVGYMFLDLQGYPYTTSNLQKNKNIVGAQCLFCIIETFA
jgi:hypothetical protein